MRLIRDADAEERVILASFSHRTLYHLRVAGYRGTSCLSQAEVVGNLLGPSWLMRHLPYRGSAAQIPTRHGPITLATRRNIDHLHEQGIRVDFWTINDPGHARELLELGADGIMTDDPRAIAPVFAECRS
jgi:glycerophosphoryl diester phosphodiesterase